MFYSFTDGKKYHLFIQPTLYLFKQINPTCDYTIMAPAVYLVLLVSLLSATGCTGDSDTGGEFIVKLMG